MMKNFYILLFLLLFLAGCGAKTGDLGELGNVNERVTISTGPGVYAPGWAAGINANDLEEYTRIAALEGKVLSSVSFNSGTGVVTLTMTDATTKTVNLGITGSNTGDNAVNTLYSGLAAAKENALGNPGTTGYVLSSTSAGVRSWIPPASGGTMTWPSIAGIPYWTSGTAWGGAYNSSTKIPANYIPSATNSSDGVATAAQVTEQERLSAATLPWVDGQSGLWFPSSQTVNPSTYCAAHPNGYTYYGDIPMFCDSTGLLVTLGGARSLSDLLDWPSGLTATELGYVDGATSNIQAQLSSMQAQINSLSGGTDTTPNAFSFTDQTGVALSSTITSAPITVSGINAASTITVSGGTYDKNASGTFVSTSGTVLNGDTVRARHTSSGTNSTAVNTIVTIGGVSDTFTSTTTAAGGTTAEYSDNFNRATLDSNWTAITGATFVTPSIIGSTQFGTTNVTFYKSASAFYNAGSTSTVTQWGHIEIAGWNNGTEASTADAAVVYLRSPGITGNGYAFEVDNNGSVNLTETTNYEWIRTVATGTAAFTPHAAVKFGFVISGTGSGTTHLKVWVNPVNTTPTDASNWDSSSDTADFDLSGSITNTSDTAKGFGLGVYEDGASLNTDIRLDNLKVGSF